jgi:tetratricopeptide (TPR) repeat protein
MSELSTNTRSGAAFELAWWSGRIGPMARCVLRLLSLNLFVLVLSGCVGSGPILAPQQQRDVLPESVELTQTPFFPQEDYQCGPAALATILADAGLHVVPDDLVEKVYIPDRRGSLQIEMLAATRSLGRLPYVIDPDLGALMAELAAGRPVLVLQNLGFKIAPLWHYAVVAGYDVESDDFVLRSGLIERKLMPASKFISTWKGSDNWAMIALRPGELPVNPNQERYLTSAAAMEDAGQPEAAMAAYKAALEYWPQSSTALFGMANTYYASGDLSEAEMMYRRLLASEPNDTAVLNNLAQVLLDQGRCPEALGTIDRARSLTDPQANLSKTLDESRDTIIERCADDTSTSGT